MWLVPRQSELGRLGVAIELGRMAERILRLVLADDPHSAQKKRDLMVSHYKLGGLFLASNDRAPANESFQAGIDALDEMIAAGQWAEQSQREKAILMAELRNCDEPNDGA